MTDVSDHGQLEAAAAATEAAFGLIDLWVNPAMVSVYSTFADLTPEEFKHVVDMNLPGVNTTPFRWTKNKTGHPCRPAGIIYQPEVAAEAVLFCVENVRREIMLALPTVESTRGEKVIPGLLRPLPGHGRLGWHPASGTAEPRPQGQLLSPPARRSRQPRAVRRRGSRPQPGVLGDEEPRQDPRRSPGRGPGHGRLPGRPQRVADGSGERLLERSSARVRLTAEAEQGAIPVTHFGYGTPFALLDPPPGLSGFETTRHPPLTTPARGQPLPAVAGAHGATRDAV